MKCFYHGSDLDGKCSGAIVRKVTHTNNMSKCEFIPYYYKDFPYSSIEKDELVLLVDCSCDFEELLKITKNVVWIDHHITAIEKYKCFNIPGLQEDGISACELTWKHFYPDVTVPPVVRLLGDYDVWKFKYGEDSKVLQAGIRLFDSSVESPMWDIWLNPEYFPHDELSRGKIASLYREDYYKSVVKKLVFFTMFEGHKAVCCNASCVGSMLFDSVKDNFDIMMPFDFDGKGWNISIYTTKDDIDCSEIAKKYGGGGHKKAAGFRCTKLPFKEVT